MQADKVLNVSLSVLQPKYDPKTRMIYETNLTREIT